MRPASESGSRLTVSLPAHNPSVTRKDSMIPRTKLAATIEAIFDRFIADHESDGEESQLYSVLWGLRREVITTIDDALTTDFTVAEPNR